MRKLPVRGFALTELLVVLAIIGVVSTIVFTSQSSFNTGIILSNTAYDVALTVHDVQNYGIAGRVASGGVTNAGYGIHFDRTLPSRFDLFADTDPAPSTNPNRCHPARDINAPDAHPGDCAYDAAADALVDTYALGNGVTITEFCAHDSDDKWWCANSNPPGPGGRIDVLDITFVRPNADMTIRTDQHTINNPYVTEACVDLVSREGAHRYVQVKQFGLIRSMATTCLPS